MTNINVTFTRDSTAILIPSEKTYKVEIGNIHLELFSYVEHESKRDYSETWYWLENRVFDLYTDQVFNKSFYTVGEALDDALETMIKICQEPDNEHMQYCLEDIENFKKSHAYENLKASWNMTSLPRLYLDSVHIDLLPLPKPVWSIVFHPCTEQHSDNLELAKKDSLRTLREIACLILEQTEHLI